MTCYRTNVILVEPSEALFARQVFVIVWCCERNLAAAIVLCMSVPESGGRVGRKSSMRP